MLSKTKVFNLQLGRLLSNLTEGTQKKTYTHTNYKSQILIYLERKRASEQKNEENSYFRTSIVKMKKMNSGINFILPYPKNSNRSTNQSNTP